MQAFLCDMQRNFVQKAEMDISERLRQARQKAGFNSAADAARRLNIPYGTYSGHENGSRGIKREDVDRYARAFGVSRSWLEYGQDMRPFGRDTVEILGEFGVVGDGQVQWHDQPGTMTAILMPNIFGCSASALWGAGDNMKPYAYYGSLILFKSQFTTNIQKLDRYICVCILEDQRVFIRSPRLTEIEGVYNLVLNPFEPLLGVRVERAAPVLAVISVHGYELLLESHEKIVEQINDAARSRKARSD